MNNNPKMQHDLPAAYLRRFASKKNHVWCQYNHSHQGLTIEEKSVKSDLFKHEDIYTIDNSPIPYAFENLFNEDLENKYFSVFSKLKTEEEIAPELIGYLSLWMYFSKMRILNYKGELIDSFRSFMKESFDENGNQNFKTHDEIDNYIDLNEKEIHLKTIFSSDQISEFCDLMVGKSWEVLKITNDMSFLTNDNPGFSINNKTGILSCMFSIEPEDSNFYPISPKICLHTLPIKYSKEDDFDIPPKIYYKTINERLVDFINWATIKFHKRYLIASSKEELEKIEKNSK